MMINGECIYGDCTPLWVYVVGIPIIAFAFVWVMGSIGDRLAGKK